MKIQKANSSNFEYKNARILTPGVFILLKVSFTKEPFDYLDLIAGLNCANIPVGLACHNQTCLSK